MDAEAAASLHCCGIRFCINKYKVQLPDSWSNEVFDEPHDLLSVEQENTPARARISLDALNYVPLFSQA